MKILKFPNKELLTACGPITVFGEELKVMLDSMWETMIENNGIGLAANQVGLQYRMFTMLGPDDEKLYIVNPKILDRSLAPANIREGCLSAPGEFLVLSERASWVEVEFQNENGEFKKRVFKDLYAVCFQHENDHLNGETHLQSLSLSKQKRKELAKKWGIK